MEVYNVNSVAEAYAKDADAIQAVLDKAAPGDRVVIPRYNKRAKKNEWRIHKAVELPTGITLVLDNAFLVHETGVYENMFTNKKGAHDFSIIGEGNTVLHGGALNYLMKTTEGTRGLPSITKNACIYFEDASGITVENLTFEEPRWASIYTTHVSDVKISHITFDMVPLVKGLLGMEFSEGTKNVLIDTVNGRTGVDTVLLKTMKAGEENAVSGIRIKNLITDPNFSALVRISAYNGGQVHDIDLETIVDSSDFFDKKRTISVLAVGSTENPGAQPAVGDIRNIHAKTMFSRSSMAVSVNASMKDSLIEDLFTFGDNIYAIQCTRYQKDVKLDNLVFDRVFYGKGSEPNNSNSFISRQAVGSVAVKMDLAQGEYQIKHLYLENQEAENA